MVDSDNEYFEGSYNSLSSPGTLIKNPRVLLRLSGSEQWYGKFRVPTDADFEYVIHRTEGVTLGGMSAYLEREEPVVVVKVMKDGNEDEHRFKYQDGEWNEVT